MKQFKLAMAILIALAMATPALAFNVEWHGDFNNRFSFSTQADMSSRTSRDEQKYYNGLYSTYDKNSIPNPAKNENDSDFFGEIKYRMDMRVSDDEKKIQGVIGFEFGSAKFGDANAPFGGDKNNFELRWAYVDLEVPFDPASRLSVGLQPVGYNYLLWSDNAGGVKWTRTDGAFKYSLGWFRNDVAKGTGGDDKSAYDDAYGADVTYVFENGNSLNAFVLYMDQGEEDVYSIATNAAAGTVQDEEIWLGISGKGKWNNLSAMGTAIYLTGEVTADTAGAAGLVDESADREAYLVHGQLDYKMDKTTFTFGGIYASGDDDATDNDMENFDVIDISTSILGSVCIFDNYADDNSFSQAPYVFDKGYQLIYAGVKQALNDKTDVWFKYFWHNTAEDVELAGASGDEVGHEFVVGVSYKIMKGLTADINAGYLVAGDALDTIAEFKGEDEADDIFRTDARIQLKF